MTRTLAFVLLIFLAGCSCSPKPLLRPNTAGKVWDTTYLIDLSPALVTDQGLELRADDLAEHYWRYNQVEGVIWPGYRSSAALEFPDKYGTGGDAAIFTGFATAGFSFQYGRQGDRSSLMRALRSLGGLYWLTHIAGPGVVARCVFPIDKGEKWDYPGDRWKKYPAFMHAGAVIPTPWGGNYPAGFYYTRATKDQFTGILFGLTAAWLFLDEVPGVKETIARTMVEMRAHLVKHHWRIRDENGKNDTSADHIDGMMRLQFEALYRRTIAFSDPSQKNAAQAKYMDWYHTVSLADLFNIGNNYQQYYAHSLRATRAFTIWLLEDDTTRRNELARWVKRSVWRYVSDHQHAWAAAIMGVMHPDDPKPKRVLKAALQSHALKPLRAWGSPYAGQKHAPKVGAVLVGCEDNWVLPPHLRKPTNYWTWQKRPWDAGPAQDPEGRTEETGIDFIVPYQVGKWFGLLP